MTPDLMAMAKALTNGTVPMGAVAVRDTIYEPVIGTPPAGAIELFQGTPTRESGFIGGEWK
jgi:beta-alanine--pyruvate transaminase